MRTCSVPPPARLMLSVVLPVAPPAQAVPCVVPPLLGARAKLLLQDAGRCSFEPLSAAGTASQGAADPVPHLTAAAVHVTAAAAAAAAAAVISTKACRACPAWVLLLLLQNPLLPRLSKEPDCHQQQRRTSLIPGSCLPQPHCWRWSELPAEAAQDLASHCCQAALLPCKTPACKQQQQQQQQQQQPHSTCIT